MKLIPISWRLKLLSRKAAPRPEFERELRLKLLERGLGATPTRIPFYMRTAGVIASIVLVFGAGTATYAYTSDDVLPEHPLYPIRQSVEDAEGALALTPRMRDRIARKHLARKVREIEVLKRRVPQMQVEDKPAGVALERLQVVMQKGLETDATVEEIKQDIVKEVREAKRQIVNPQLRRQLKIIEKRLEKRR